MSHLEGLKNPLHALLMHDDGKFLQKIFHRHASKEHGAGFLILRDDSYKSFTRLALKVIPSIPTILALLGIGVLLGSGVMAFAQMNTKPALPLKRATAIAVTQPVTPNAQQTTTSSAGIQTSPT